MQKSPNCLYLGDTVYHYDVFMGYEKAVVKGFFDGGIVLRFEGETDHDGMLIAEPEFVVRSIPETEEPPVRLTLVKND